MLFTPKTQPAFSQSVVKSAANANRKMSARERNKIYLLLGISLIGIVAVFFVEPIPQDHAYHHFADSRTLFSIANFWNVVSNLPFLVFGLAGFLSIVQRKPTGILLKLTAAYLLFFTGIFFTGIGSAYYHYYPTNATLLWDRLPMTIAFMAFFAIIIGEFISLKAGRKLLLPLLLIGAGSVIYWHFTEQAGRGDLRFYALVQFLPIILIPVIMGLFRSAFNTNLYIWLIIATYLMAKIFETYDEQVYEILNQISGHTIKHFMASLVPLIFLIGLYKRRLITTENQQNFKTN